MFRSLKQKAKTNCHLAIFLLFPIHYKSHSETALLAFPFLLQMMNDWDLCHGLCLLSSCLNNLGPRASNLGKTARQYKTGKWSNLNAIFARTRRYGSPCMSTSSSYRFHNYVLKALCSRTLTSVLQFSYLFASVKRMYFMILLNEGVKYWTLCTNCCRRRLRTILCKATD